MNILPPTKSAVLSVLVIAGCTFMAHLLYNSAVAYLSGLAGPFPTASLLLAALIPGLWRLTEWSRIALTVIIVALSILVPLGGINPFDTMDMQIRPSVDVKAFKTYIPVAVALLYVYLIGRYRSEFRKKLF